MLTILKIPSPPNFLAHSCARNTLPTFDCM